jgi:hypothetical protein
MGVLDGIQTAGYSLWFIVLCLLIFLSVASLVNNVIYNLYQHPLHGIPGPKIAGATYLYQSYYSLCGTSTYYKRIREMHAQYGTSDPQISIVESMESADINIQVP